MRLPPPLLALLLVSPPAGAQAPEFRFESDLKIALPTDNVVARRAGGVLVVSRSGRMAHLREAYRSPVKVFDADGRDLEWPLIIGREQDIGWVRTLGWVGDSLWIADRAFDQLVLVGPAGHVVRSFETPAWVRPRWGERRRYPLFSSMQWEALYADGTMLVLPLRPRAIFDTPQYDRSLVHLLRVDRDGRILNTVARVPDGDGRIQLRDGTQRRMQRVPFFARSHWEASSDGERVAVVTPSLSDSGAFHVAMLDGRGDTVFSATHRARANRLRDAQKDTVLLGVRAFGRYSAQQVRDSLRKLMPAFESPVVNVTVGVDYSLWVWLREPGAAPQDWLALILDPAGAVVGTARLPRSFRAAKVSKDYVWAITREGNSAAIERFRRVPARAARPTRSARTSASSSR